MRGIRVWLPRPRWEVRRLTRDHQGKLLTLLRAFPPEEPTKKRFVEQMIAWSCAFGEFPNGDPELHHVAGTLYAEGTFSIFADTSFTSPSHYWQMRSRTKRSVTWPLAPKTPRSSLPGSSTTGTSKTIPIPQRYMPPELCSRTSSLVISAPPTRLSLSSHPASAPPTNLSACKKSAAPAPICGFIPRCRS